MLAAGSTTLVIPAAPAMATLIADDNKPAIMSTNAKLRLVHGVGA